MAQFDEAGFNEEQFNSPAAASEGDVQIIIGGVDRTLKVIPESLRLERALTNQIDQLSFTVVRKGQQFYKPSEEEVVTLFEGTTKIFGGQIVDIEETIEAAELEVFKITCKDFSYHMDRTLVIDSFEDKTVDFIIADIFANHLQVNGYTINNVDAPIVVGFVQFNYEYPTKCLQQLAEIINYDWYVDEEKDIHFFSKSAKSAPFGLTDTNEKYYYNSLKLRGTTKNIKNQIIVRGGIFLGSTATESEDADGIKLIYKQGNRYSGAGGGIIVVKVDSVSQSVGTDNLSDPASFDVLYNFQEKFLRFKASTKPALGELVELTGDPHLPVIVKVSEPQSIAQFGIREFKIVDKSIDTKDGARDRGRAELFAWSNTLNEGGFTTREPGLDTGQEINVQSDIREVDRNYVISRISSRLINGREFEHSCIIVTTRTFGMIEFLQRLLINKDKDIEINPDEILHEVVDVQESIVVEEVVAVGAVAALIPETITVGEAVVNQGLDFAIEWYWGVVPSPSAGIREGRWDSFFWQ